MKNSTTLSKISFLVTGTALIFLFYFIVYFTQQNELIYPTYSQIFSACGSLLSSLFFYQALALTFLKTFLIIFISLILSLIISFIYLLKKDLFNLFKPLLVLLKSTPLAVISVYLWIALGSKMAPYLISLLMVFPVMVQGVISSIDEINTTYLNALKLENVSFIKKYFKIYLPLIFPYIVMVTLQTFGLGIKVMIMGEYICQSQNSLGKIVYLYKQNLQFDYLLGLLMIIVIIVFILESIIKLINNKLNPLKND